MKGFIISENVAFSLGTLSQRRPAPVTKPMFFGINGAWESNCERSLAPASAQQPPVTPTRPRSCPWSPRTTSGFGKTSLRYGTVESFARRGADELHSVLELQKHHQGEALGVFHSFMSALQKPRKNKMYLIILKLGAFLGWCEPNTSQQIVLARENQKATQKQTATAV